MKDKLKYEVIADEVLSAFERRVNEKINQGFELVGGLTIETTAEGPWFYQAVIKRGTKSYSN